MEIHFKITIDDRLVTLWRKVFTIKTIIFFVAVCFFTTGLLIFSGEFDTAYTFKSNDIISSAEVNQNFRDLAERTLGTISDIDIAEVELNDVLKFNGINWYAGNDEGGIEGDCEWDTVVGGINYTDGNVGIGTTGPNNKLDINGSVGIHSNTIQADSGLTPALVVGDPSDGTKWVGLGYDDTADCGFIYAVETQTEWKNLVLNPLSGNVGVGTMEPDVALDVNGFTQLGSEAPKVKMKKITGTTASAEGNAITIAHGLTPDKIISFTLKVEYSPNSGMPAAYIGDSIHQVVVFHDFTNFIVTNVPSNSSDILSRPFTIVVWYEE